MKINVDKIYILHHPVLTERKNYLIEKLSNIKNVVEWVEKFSPDEIDYENLMKGWEFYKQITIYQINNKYENFSMKISPKSLSLLLKHKYCYEDQIKNNYKHILILEDDIEIIENFENYINVNINDYLELEKNENVGMLMIGGYSGFYVKNTIKNQYAYYNENQKTRCTHAYILNLDSSMKILKNFHPYNLPIDFKLNEIIQVENIKVAWSEPAIYQKNYNI